MKGPIIHGKTYKILFVRYISTIAYGKTTSWTISLSKPTQVKHVLNFKYCTFYFGKFYFPLGFQYRVDFREFLKRELSKY